ncbi:MAG: hypothetical protein ACP5XB_27545, partial [Isosphaeraceae bacterium]
MSTRAFHPGAQDSRKTRGSTELPRVYRSAWPGTRKLTRTGVGPSVAQLGGSSQAIQTSPTRSTRGNHSEGGGVAP